MDFGDFLPIKEEAFVENWRLFIIEHILAKENILRSYGTLPMAQIMYGVSDKLLVK